MAKKHSLLFGAHMSTAGGFENALIRGASIGCTTIQLFTKSNRQWATKPITPEEIVAFETARATTGIKTVVAHAAYLINIGSPDSLLLEKSIQAVCDELVRCEQLSIPYLVLHPGSATDSNEPECLARIAKHLNRIFEVIPNNVTILLEVMAGQGSSVCYKLEHIATIIDALTNKDRIGVCLDTCHAFAAGYDLRTAEHYKAFWLLFDRLIGLNKLKVIHLNDSKKDIGSRVDRHEDIGKGLLGLEPFRLFFNDPRFFDIPKILETPKEGLSDDAQNLKTLVQLISNATKKVMDMGFFEDMSQ